MNVTEELSKIYKDIPDFTCKQGCYECCGPIQWTSVENVVIQEYMDKHNIENIHWSIEDYVNNNMLCPYLKDEKCIIYPVRPLVCRLFGVCKGLKCPYGKTSKIMSQRDSDNILRRLKRLERAFLA